MRYLSSSSRAFSRRLRNSLVVAASLFAPLAARAQTAVDKLKTIGAKTGQNIEDPRVVVAGIIQTFLGLIGVIFLILLVYAGVMYMTAGGEEEKVKKATTTIRRAIIGILIILCAYAISLFVVNAVLTATT